MGQFKSRLSYSEASSKEDVKVQRPVRRFKQSAEGHVDEVLILDTDFDPDLTPESGRGYYGLPFVWEHVKHKNGRANQKSGYPESKDIYQQCTVDNGSCPGCDGRLLEKLGKFGSDARLTRDFNVYTSILHLKPKDRFGEPVNYTTGEREGKVIPYVKCLMPLQNNRDSNLNAIMDVLIDAYWENNPETGKPYKSIYGVKLRLKRTSNMVPVGEPIRFPKKEGEKGAPVKFKRLSFEEMRDTYGSAAVDKGKYKIPANNYITQYDYEKVFPADLHEKDVCEKYGIPYAPPAAQNDNSMYDGTDEDMEFDDDIPFDEDDSSSNKPAERKTKGGSKPEVTDKELADLELEDFDDDIPFD